ncbi:MAG TPA: pirin family protein [Salinimicrobium sp.]|nr:pirin family protein [Salinimicrobium sp.]
MRKIRKIHHAEYRPIADLITYSPLPTRSLEMIDPFLFLNHHGPQIYPPNNKGLPFGPHPHRGMETVTFIINGDIAHEDNSGHKSIINKGGVQWMTAGSGLLHAEVSSEEFKQNGGLVEILQLWINLPAKLKMTKPNYTGLQRDQIPHLFENEKNISIDLIAGKWKGESGAFSTLTDVFLSTLNFSANSEINIQVPEEENILFYVIKGDLTVNNSKVTALNLIEFENSGKDLKIEASQDSLVLFGHAKPFNEPIVARGPFVMNSIEEIDQAYDDFQNGKMGVW